MRRLYIMEKKLNYLTTIIKTLPKCCREFLTETGTELATSTRLAYARELDTFFHYLVYKCEKFYGIGLQDFSINNLRIVTPQDISRYLTYYKDMQLKERTIARKRATLSRFFNYMTNNQKLSYNPVLAAVKVKIHKTDRLIYLNNDEQSQFLDGVITGDGMTNRMLSLHGKYMYRDLSIMLLFLDTGIRVSELSGINIGDFDFKKNSVVVLRKGGNYQTVYFSDDTKEILQYYHESRMVKFRSSSSKDAFFISQKGIRLSIRAIELLVKKYAICNLPGKGKSITPHKLRSSFAMTFYGETSDLLALKTKLNHASFSVLDVYTKATDKQMYEYRNVTSEARNDKANNYLIDIPHSPAVEE